MLPTVIGGKSARNPVTPAKPVTKPIASPYGPQPAPGYSAPLLPAVGQNTPTAVTTPIQTTVAPPAGVNKPVVNPSSYDISGDPILQQQLGLNTKILNQAASQKTADQKKLLLGFGSTELAKTLFGGDQGFQDAVANNPFSVLAQIAHTYEGKTGLINTTNEDLNKQNLFYSGYRTGTVLPELAHQRGQQTYDQTQLVQDAIDKISQQYTGVANQTAQSEINARNDALQRATQAALQSGYGPGANTTTEAAPTPPPGPGSPSWTPNTPTLGNGFVPGVGQPGYAPTSLPPGVNPIFYFK